jgi:hypothetical protein
MTESTNRKEFQTAEEVLLAASKEVQDVVKKTLLLARSTATGKGSITKDDVVEIIRSIVK